MIKLSVRKYNSFVKPKYKLTKKEFDVAYGDEYRKDKEIEIPSRITKTGNLVRMW